MTKQIKTSITIQATKEKVWEVLTNFEDYPTWNPFIKSVSGNIKVGNKIKVVVQGMTFTPILLTFQKNEEIKWLGHLWIKGLFDGEHKFKLTENEDGSTQLEHSEYFSGVLVKLFAKRLDNETVKGFVEMNEQLKTRVENNN